MSSASSPLRLGAPAEILAAVPMLVGFQPSDSLVVLVLHGRRRRLRLVVRLDLPPGPRSDDESPEVVEQVRRCVERASGDSVLLVVYAVAPADDEQAARRGPGPLPWSHLVAALARTLQVDDALLAAGGRFWSYVCSAPCCPPGSPLPDQPPGAAAHLAAATVLAGRSVLPDRAALEASLLPRRSEARRRRWEHLVAEVALGTRAAPPARSERRRETLDLLADLVQRRQAGGEPVTDAEAARVLVGLRDVETRDRAITLALDADDAAYVALLVELCAAAEAAQAAPVCSVLACAAYLRGDGALANVALARALDAEPDAVLPQLLATALQHQVPPSQVRELLRTVRDDLAVTEDPGERPPNRTRGGVSGEGRR